MINNLVAAGEAGAEVSRPEPPAGDAGGRGRSRCKVAEVAKAPVFIVHVQL